MRSLFINPTNHVYIQSIAKRSVLFIKYSINEYWPLHNNKSVLDNEYNQHRNNRHCANAHYVCLI